MTTEATCSILRSRDVTPADLARVGGKGIGLARLARAGQSVPPWFAISADAYRAVANATGLSGRIEALLADVHDREPEARRAAFTAIRDWIRKLEIPGQMSDSIARAHSDLFSDDGAAAVRSSVVEEDSATASFAGLHDSFLFVRGRDSVLEAVKNVWASAYNDRALVYRRERSLPLTDIAVAVLVQKMVDAETSGVMFTVNPDSGDVYEIVVSSLYGAGAGLVSVGLDADTFVVDKETLEIRDELVSKDERMAFDEAGGGGLVRVPVAESLRSEASLTPDQVRAVARAGSTIESSLRRPQDVEFSFDREGHLHVLQTRPVTVVEELGPAAGNRLIWDNSNIIESYSGVTSPMTFSFIRHAYTIVYHCFSEVMGIRPEVVRRNRGVFENMLGLFRGQVYYNIRNWHRLIRLFPGYEYNKGFMESMMGVRKSLALDEDPVPSPGWRQRYLVELPSLVRLVLRSTRNFLFIRRIVDDFDRLFRECCERWSSLDFAAMAPHDLMAVYREMEDELLWNWKAPIINDFFVMIFYGALKKACIDWCGDESGSLQNDLMCGEGGIESVAPTRMLLKMAEEANADPELREFLLTSSPDRLVDEVPRDPRFRELARSVERYLRDYGFRCVNELKLEEYSLKDRPAFLYQILRNYLQMKDPETRNAEAQKKRETTIRRDAERRAFAALEHGAGRIVRKWLFRWVLANARLGVKNRENMRFARSRIYGLLRELLRAIGDGLASDGIIDGREDVFFLTLGEVRDFIYGTAVTTDLRGLVALRRAEFESYRSDTGSTPDDRFETFGLAYHGNRFRGRPTPVADDEKGVLRGIGCCPGRVRGPVKVVRSPVDGAELQREILVAERTDPGWIPLYPSASGILIERGSILSHSAIVAREMGIPTIVGISGLTATLTSGQEVAMDGTTGTVRLATGSS